MRRSTFSSLCTHMQTLILTHLLTHLLTHPLTHTFSVYMIGTLTLTHVCTHTDLWQKPEGHKGHLDLGHEERNQAAKEDVI